MTLPVSSYEELLNRVRSLTHETRQLQRQIDAPLLDHNENERQMNPSLGSEWSFKPRTEGFSALDPSRTSTPQPNKDVIGTRWTKEQGASPEAKEQEETSTQASDRGMKLISGQNTMCHSTAAVNTKQAMCDGGLSYSYSYSSEQLGTKVEMVYNLLSMLGTHDRADMTSTLLAMSSSPDSCKAMRQSGCLSLLVQLVHSSGESTVVRQRAAEALRNMVLCHSDDKRGRREARVLRLLEQVTNYSDSLTSSGLGSEGHCEESHPGPAIAALMKLSFDEEHRLAMCQLGALYVIARLVQVEAPYHQECCVTLKRYAGMALTNLTFGDGNNKALLCSMKPFMAALVAQLSSNSEDLTQVTASVLRNLSWRADAASKQSLREVGSVPALMRAAMAATREQTLKSVLSALWNLSAHCNINKVDICSVEGALQYLVEMLNYQSSSKTLSVIENSGGILRNISSHIAVREDYRKILREHNCLAILLRQLQSASLTVVSNACGTLWNLSARCATDQRALVALGAVPMLTSLAHSKHRMIAMGASAALKNLLPVRLAQQQAQTPSGSATLLVRKRRALEAELNSSLSETCDNIDPSPIWDAEQVTTTPAKEDCDQINQTIQHIEETSDQPVNYSLKYCEKENKTNETDNDAVNYSIKFKDAENSEQKPYFNEETGGDYAETDLDQLTDYSLRYNEEEQTEQQDSPSPSLNKCKEIEKPNEPVNSVEASPGKLDSGKPTTLETPLMFSRCSSLGSLSSCEQQDDCRSSVVSEFSRMTSGILSPSEVPDSPTQTIPPSPRVKVPPVLTETNEAEEKPSGQPGVFDDAVVAFKEESTPAQFSTATSLSDLTFDDEGHEGRKEIELAAVSEEEDEHVLADCINIGMQNNRDRVESGSMAQNSRIPRVRGIPVKIPTRQTQHMEDTPVQFCTEDTPASLSHATSHSELSCALSDASSDHENILAECIQSGMPQAQNGSQVELKAKVSQVAPRGKATIVKPRPVSIPTPRMRQLVAEDEVSVFATEGSPGNFSIRSSLSDLTINSKPERLGIETPPPAENPSPLSSLDPDVDEVEAVTVLSGASADEVTLAEQEDQALLMQVISSGMPSVPDKMKDSTDTWAEETPNDMSYPSLSMAPPVIHSYDSAEDEDDKDKTDQDITLTESRVIKLNSGKVALISHLEMENSFVGIDEIQPPSNMASMISMSSCTSINDKYPKKDFKLTDSLLNGSVLELDQVQPPSAMDSIISLSCSIDVDKKKLPQKEASLLENVKPPTEMEEMVDLDNSIMSVASISSEIADGIDDITLEATPPSQRKMTPKQRRELGKFRYNTYVIKGEPKGGKEQVQEVETKPKERTTPKQRRQADRDRFRTRTINDVPPPPNVERLSSVESESQASEGSISPLEQPSESPSEAEEPPRPIVVKPPEVKSIRGGASRSSAIPVVRSPVKIPQPAVKKKSQVVQPLQRQGTFTKDEASSSIPVPIKKIASPLKKNPIAPSKNAAGRGRAASLPNKPGFGVRTSVSNQSLKSACSDQSGSGRWHSNSSLNSQAAAPVKKEATSKIASLWKKVDESKKKQTGKDSRVWIPPEPKNKQMA
ncbi:adenomatous polyposis coli homolog isoform X2 [Cimex lectularius]|uniref:Adenomatous polyposis coli protein-like n=1 Tax=Cimex lectularius TaxID=79782 RepID=A0A8I6RFI9_CIMLE|nr:adenomatous polyposis coli homolog isoform X2 [Cimex lectularius]